MIDQLLDEIEAAKASLQDWQRKEREAHDQVLLGRGYLQAMVRVLELVQTAGQKEAAPIEAACDDLRSTPGVGEDTPAILQSDSIPEH